MIYKESNKCKIIDFTVSFDTSADSKVLKDLWNMTVEVIHVLMGVLCTPLRNLKESLGEIGISTKIVDLEKTAIFYSARIL